MLKIGAKLLQRKFYSFLNSRWGFSLILVLAYLSLRPIILLYTDPCSLRGGNSLHCSTINFQENIVSQNLEAYLAYGPIDVVYTWVNGSDPIWMEKKELWSKKYEFLQSTADGIKNDINFTTSSNDSTHSITEALILNTTDSESTDENKGKDDTNSNNRYRNSNELKYSLRSLIKNAPWVHHIYIITDNQIPSWLNLETNRLTIVTHEEIFSNKSHLPVFSSPAIETHIHKIPNLSKKFIYFNDDVFLGSPVSPEDFVSLQGVQKLTMSWDVPKCAPGCSDSWIGDGYCDKACNVSACNFDFPDCINGSNAHGNHGHNGKEQKPVIHCQKGCPDNWLGDKICDIRCKSEECGYDAGDCGVDLVLDGFPGGLLTLDNALVTVNDHPLESYKHVLQTAQRRETELRQVYEAARMHHNHSQGHNNSGNSSSISSSNSSDNISDGGVDVFSAESVGFSAKYYNFTRLWQLYGAEGSASQIENTHHSVDFNSAEEHSDLTGLNGTSHLIDSNTIAGISSDNTAFYNNSTETIGIEENNPEDNPDFSHTLSSSDYNFNYGDGANYHSGMMHYGGSDDPIYGYRNRYNDYLEPKEPAPAEVVVSVYVGTKAVYIDLSILPCLLARNTSCNPLQENYHRRKAGVIDYNREISGNSDFQYRTAEHSDEWNQIVQSAVIVQKHNLLVVILLAEQEDRPQPPMLPHNVTITVTGEQLHTGDTVTAKFVLQIVKVLANSNSYVNYIPDQMSLVNATLTSVVHHHHSSGSGSSGGSSGGSSSSSGSSDAHNAAFPVSSVKVIAIPYTNHSDSSQDQTTESDSQQSIDHPTTADESNIDVSTNSLLPIDYTQEGIILQVKLSKHTTHHAQYDNLLLSNIHLQHTITTLKNKQYTLSLPLAQSIGFLQQHHKFVPLYAPHNTKRHRDLSGVTLKNALERSAETHKNMTIIEYYNSGNIFHKPTNSLNEQNRISASTSSSNGDSNSDTALAAGNNNVLYVMLPVHRRYQHTKSRWLHFRTDVYITNTTTSSVTAADSLSHSHDSISQWTELQLTTNDTATHFEQHIATSPGSPLLSHKAVTFVGMFKWGLNITDTEEISPAIETTADSASNETSADAIDLTSVDHNSTVTTNNATETQHITADLSAVFESTDSETTTTAAAAAVDIPTTTADITTTTDTASSRRRLQDTYAQSLIHVNRLYNRNYGVEARKVPAHLPHMIDTEIMREMQTKYSKEWLETSKHRFRSVTDMQYSFSYYYYVIHRHKANPPDLLAFIARYVDTNYDNLVDYNELNTLVSIIKGRTATPEEVKTILDCVLNVGTIANNSSAAGNSSIVVTSDNVVDSVNGTSVNVTQKSLLDTILEAFSQPHKYPSVADVYNCSLVKSGLKEKIDWDKRAPTHVIQSDKDLVAFEMIGDNYTDTLNQLNSVRARQSRFICINDNMKNPSPELLVALENFYTGFFPIPSIFELPPGYSNPTLYVTEYRAMKATLWNTVTSRVAHWVDSVVSTIVGYSKSTIVHIARSVIRSLDSDNSGGSSGGVINSINKNNLGNTNSNNSINSNIKDRLWLSFILCSVVLVVLFIVIALRAFRRPRSTTENDNNNNNSSNNNNNSSKKVKQDILRGRNEGKHLSSVDYTEDSDGRAAADRDRRESFSGLANLDYSQLDAENRNPRNKEKFSDDESDGGEDGSFDDGESFQGENMLNANTTANKSSDSSMVAALPGIVASGEEYFNALLRNVGWTEDDANEDNEHREEQDEGDYREGNEDDDEETDRGSFHRANQVIIDTPIHRHHSGDSQQSSSRGNSQDYASQPVFIVVDNSEETNSPIKPPSKDLSNTAGSRSSGKLRLFKGSGGSKSRPVSTSSVPDPSIKSILKRKDRPVSTTNTPRIVKHVRFSNTVYQGIAADIPENPPPGKRKYPGHRLVALGSFGLNMLKGVLASDDGGNLYGTS